MADAGAMAKNDAKIAGARYFIIFMLFPHFGFDGDPDRGINSRNITSLT